MGTSYACGYFDHGLFGGNNGRDRKADPSAYSGASQTPNPGNYRATSAAAQIIAARQIALQQAILSAGVSFQNPPDDPEITVKSTGIEVGEIIAYRAWRITDGVLTSLVMTTPWLPGETVEGTLKGRGLHGKLHGIYSFKKAGDAWNGCANTGEICVSGQVALWGEVVEHEEGYRAENARVYSLDFIRPETPQTEILLSKLRQRYGLAA